jgi:hypothetical protein
MHPAASRRSDRSGSRRRRGSAEDDWLGSLRIRASGGHQMMRQSRERGLGHKRERGITLPRRNRRSLSSGTADSGGKILAPGNQRGGGGLFIGTARARTGQGVMRIEEGENSVGSGNSPARFSAGGQG